MSHALHIFTNAGRRPRGLLLLPLCLWACVNAAAPHAFAQSVTNEVRRATSCGAHGPRKKGLFGMRFDVPKGMESKKVRDVDYVLFYVYPKGNRKEHLDLWSGPTASGGSPSEKLLASSVEVRQSKWACEENGGTDFYGRAKDGRRWRYTTMFEGLATYENVSEETARRFDEIIDGMCCDAEFFKKLTGKN